MHRLLLLLGIALLVTSCSSRPEARVGWDTDGVPVTVTVTYDREALPMLTDGGAFQRTVVVERDPLWYGGAGFYGRRAGYYGGVGGYRGFGGPPMSYEPDTSLMLLIGRGETQAQYLRARLITGTWSWTIPMTVGQEVYVSYQTDGGRSGWKAIGAFTAAIGTTAQISLEGANPALTVTCADLPRTDE